MNNEFESFFNIITLCDNEGNPHEFEELDRVEIDGRKFLAITPIEDELFSSDGEGDIYILEEVTGESGEPELLQLEDEQQILKLSEIFEKNLSEMYDFEE